MLALGFLFVAALGVRLYGIARPPMEFFPVRQYHGALLARGFYEWLLTGRLQTFPPDGIIEPPVMEFLASLAYLVSGGEHLWIPRLLSALFWMVGGVFLYLVARKVVPPNAAVFSVAFYLLIPYGVFASRAFMPDPLMVMLLVIAIFAVLRYHERPSARGLMVVAAASSLAILAKPGICLFQVLGAFWALAICRQGLSLRGLRRALLGAHTLAFAALAVLPTGLYYLYGAYVAGFLRGQTSRKISPRLLLEPSFWEGWRLSVWLVVGYVALLGALLGLLLLRKGFPRALMLGLWGGYLLFGLTFTFHVHTHSYYSLQLIPVVALSLAPVAAWVMEYLSRVGLRSYGGAIVLGVTVSVVALGVAGRGQQIGQIAHQDRAAPAYASNVATYQEIGDAVDHSRRTLVLFAAYPSGDSQASALMYHGRFTGRELPRPTQAGQASRGGKRLQDGKAFPEVPGRVLARVRRRLEGVVAGAGDGGSETLRDRELFQGIAGPRLCRVRRRRALEKTPARGVMSVTYAAGLRAQRRPLVGLPPAGLSRRLSALCRPPVHAVASGASGRPPGDVRRTAAAGGILPNGRVSTQAGVPAREPRWPGRDGMGKTAVKHPGGTGYGL